MSEAPERIWADGNAEWDSGSWGRSKEFDNDVEYVRADLFRRLRQMALDYLAAEGQAAEAYQAQLAAEAKAASITERLRDAWLVRDLVSSDFGRALAELKEEDRG